MANKELFILGGLAPDAVTTNKEESHYFKGSHEDYSRRISHEAFYNEYSDFLQKDYLLGYYCHLIADDLWLTGFFSPWLKNRIEADKEILRTYHHDFHLLNGKLAEHYDIKGDMVRDLKVPNDLPHLAGVKASELEQFLPSLMDDLVYSETDVAQPLSVFTLGQIVGYIETAVERSLYYLRLTASPS